MKPETRLLFSGEYSSWFIEESQELKDTLYEILLEDFLRRGELHFKHGSVIDEQKMISYLKNEFDHTGDYTKLKETVEKDIEEMHIYRENKKV